MGLGLEDRVGPVKQENTHPFVNTVGDATSGKGGVAAEKGEDER